jgi:hypothetical protein
MIEGKKTSILFDKKKSECTGNHNFFLNKDANASAPIFFVLFVLIHYQNTFLLMAWL